MTLPKTLHPSLPHAPLSVRRVDLDDIPRADWERLLAATPAATPFARWSFHRAWWDAYGSQASERYLVVSQDQAVEEEILSIVPLMARDATADGSARASGGGAGSALFMAASYHADYATILAPVEDMRRAIDAVLDYLERSHDDGRDWDYLDLRRLRAMDPLRGHLVEALTEGDRSSTWAVREEIEDVCPVVTLEADWERLLARLSKKARHEIRRKLRRAEGQGPLRLDYLPLEPASVERFIDLHQARWGERGLFADGQDGDRSRRFLHRLVELERVDPGDAILHIGSVSVGERVIYMLIGFSDRGTCYFYNAGMDPNALELSPGVVGTAVYLRDRIEAGDGRFDFLRGNEDYKYQWGAVDEPVHRIVASSAEARPAPASSR